MAYGTKLAHRNQTTNLAAKQHNGYLCSNRTYNEQRRQAPPLWLGALPDAERQRRVSQVNGWLLSKISLGKMTLFANEQPGSVGLD